MRRKFCIGMTLCMLLGMTALAESAEAAQNNANNVSNDKVFSNDPVGITIPQIITIKRPDDLEPRTDWVEPVRFYHAMHATQHACYDCHHEETNRYMGQDTDSFTPCSDCHADEGMLEPMSFYAAWHAKSPISCVGCHWQNHLKGNTIPPISCTHGCHPNARLSQETIKQTAHNLIKTDAAPSTATATTSPSLSTSSTAPSTAAHDIAWAVTPRDPSPKSSSHLANSKAAILSPAKDLKE